MAGSIVFTPTGPLHGTTKLNFSYANAIQHYALNGDVGEGTFRIRTYVGGDNLTTTVLYWGLDGFNYRQKAALTFGPVQDGVAQSAVGAGYADGNQHCAFNLSLTRVGP
jgi:hypothetical protein